ncbi:MAG: hypothetical protein A3E87_01440 [Gammaproteobacteria bacterium RIFCSPHIGHO2_12_FULL_35_23]|nr:MAG: hypothetical protein A3E87_01440 [Gammaproteobacteria bacterium RIFCSPHIGHO2_12_FULL_35_23]
MQLLPYLKIGHFTNKSAQTGLSVLLFEQAVKCGAWVCGSAPGTYSVLPFCQAGFSVNSIHGLMLTGGSAFGLTAVQGVMQWLHEKGRGLEVGVSVIPIVPAACIFDLNCGEVAWPSASEAYLACEQASDKIQTGQIGVGTGATVGKLVAGCQAMPGGFGAAQITQDDIVVQAFVAVNAAGDVMDEKGIIKAGAQTQGKPANSLQHIIQGNKKVSQFQAGIMNTTLIAVVTNAKFQKDELIRISKMASSGLARAIVPAFTSVDGDLVFSVSNGSLAADECVVGSMAAEASRLAILNAVEH